MIQSNSTNLEPKPFEEKISHSFLSFVQFCMKFGMTPVKWLSPIRLQNDTKKKRVNSMDKFTTYSISMKGKKITLKSYKSSSVVRLAKVLGNSPVRLFEVTNLHKQNNIRRICYSFHKLWFITYNLPNIST